jgi:hypothetical protein
MNVRPAGLALSIALLAADSDASELVPLPVKSFRVIERESGKVNYYTLVDDPVMPYIRARYKPPYETTVLGVQIEDADRQRARELRWSWRAITLPAGGNECADGKGDSAAVVYVSWKRGLRWYTLKYVWSSVGPKGWTCDRKRNPFVAQDTVILKTGGALGDWQSERIDLKAAFREHFCGNDPNAEVPDFVGVAIMSDGDQTKSESAADYAGFSLLK